MTITEISKQFNLAPDTLRYYEKVGLISDVARNNRGQRDYQDKDIERIKFIVCMRQAGLSIDTLNKYLHLYDQGDSTIKARKELLIEQREILRERLAHAKEALDRLDYKIDKL